MNPTMTVRKAKKVIQTTMVVLLVSVSIAGFAQQTERKFKGQEPVQPVSTVSKPIAKSWKGTFVGGVSGLFFNNDFKGGRLDGVRWESDTLITLTILPENEPINPSPWYAFKVWADTTKDITLKLSYPVGVKHRYSPKVSRDRVNWQSLPGHVVDGGLSYVFRIALTRDTVLVAAQPLVTSNHINDWLSRLKAKNGLHTAQIGRSGQGKPLTVVHIGDTSSHRKIVVLGRQHPPEVTGHYALQAFVETLLANTPEMDNFRRKFHVYVIPLLNPDGVDEGFWRHNTGGVDLNRDWADFNQPETRAVRDYLIQELTGADKLYFAVDFHSTHDDIYYTVDPQREGNAPGLVTRWLAAVKAGLPGYEPNIKPLYFEPPTSTAYSYLFETYGAEALVYEIGDDTPEPFIRKKSEVAAHALIEELSYLAIDTPIHLSLNENAFAPFPSVKSAIAEQIGNTNRYASAEETDRLVRLIAEKEGVRPGQVLLGELLEQLGVALALAGGEGSEFVYTVPGYPALADAAETVGGVVVKVPLNAKLENDLRAIETAVTEKTKAVFIVNPHNPSGTVNDRKMFQHFIKRIAKRTLVIVDEAYLEFSDDFGGRTASVHVREGRNVLVFRTFAKAYGLAGLPIGYAIGPESLVTKLKQQGLGATHALSTFAVVAAQAALTDTAAFAAAIDATTVERDKWHRFLDAKGLRRTASQGNFVYFDAGKPHAEVVGKLRQHGVVVGRLFAPYDTWLRISIGLPDENRYAQDQLGQVLR